MSEDLGIGHHSIKKPGDIPRLLTAWIEEIWNTYHKRVRTEHNIAV